MRVSRKPGARKAVEAAVQQLNGDQGRVGWFASAKYEGGQPVAGIAAVHEFGSPEKKIPPRLGFRGLSQEKQPVWKDTAAKISKGVVNGKLTPNRVMEALTMAAEGHMRQHITKITEPPLKEATVEARKRKLANGGQGAQASIAKPLVHTGILLNTLSSETGKK